MQYLIERGLRAEEFAHYLREIRLPERLQAYYRLGYKSNSRLTEISPEDYPVYLVCKHLYESVCHDDELLSVLLPLRPPIIDCMASYNTNYNASFSVWITRGRLVALSLLFHHYTLEEWQELVTKHVEETIARNNMTDMLDILISQEYVPSMAMLNESVAYSTVDIFDRLVVVGLSVNGPDDNSFNLEVCASKNNFVMLHRLVMYGINLHGFHGTNALLLAINAGFEDFVEELLSYGVRADRATEEGYPFFVALQTRSSLRILEILLFNGVNLNYEDEEGRTLPSILHSITEATYRQDVEDLLGRM